MTDSGLFNDDSAANATSPGSPPGSPAGSTSPGSPSGSTSSPDGPLTVRPATAADLSAMAALAAELVRFHHGLDPARFFLAAKVEEGYRGWFARELQNPGAILMVAVSGGADRVVGYVYGRDEARDWNMLLDRHVALHDVLVSEDARRSRVGELLVEALLRRAKELGAPRVVLHTSVKNERAQKLFAKLGFRPTMLEMTREI